jgi:ATP-binding cassette, subfamily B, beta-glucan exporter
MKLVRVYFRTLNILWSEERLLTSLLVFTSIFVGTVQLAEPVMFGRVIDALTKQNGVFFILALWGGLGAINIFFSVYLAVMSDRLAHRQRLNTLDQVFERVIALPVSYHSEQGSGRVVHAILSGTDILFDLWLSFMREHLSSIIGICLMVPLALTLDYRMATMLFVLASVYVVANFLIVKRTHRLQEEVASHQQTLFGRIGDVIGNVTVVQSYSRLMSEIQALQGISAQLLNAQYPILTWWGILSVITRISSTLTMVSILSFGSYLVGRGQLSVGAVVSFASFSVLLIGRLEQVSSFLSRTLSKGPALQHFFSLLDQNNVAQETPYAKAIYNIQGDVAFKNVSFKHKNSKYGVFDLNFEAKAGATIALVGPSGSGKTTTLALLQRLFDPQEGEICIDGHDVKSFTLASLRHSIATVFQDSGLFNRSIAENIRIGRPEATDQDVQNAAMQAEAHDFISGKPGGYDFVIGERGAALSGGERQRLAIARAILKNAPILIFDEATSALDNKTEKKIQDALANLRMQNKTTFVIAHRLSTVTSADQILVFKDGRIIESGTFNELRANQGLFADLVKIGELPRTTEARA